MAAPGTIHRVAFLTPQFATEEDAAGGVAGYVLKMAKALAARDIEAEVFVASDDPGTVVFQGIRVERVARERSLGLRGLGRLLRPVAGSHADLPVQLGNARRLAAALQRRHRERPFDVVQSSNYFLTGAFVPPAENRRHLIRISTSRRLFDQSMGPGHALLSRGVEAYDVRTMRRADAVYAPSRLLADHFRRIHAIDVQVLRPPAELGAEPANALPFELPERYLIHFGTLGARKGTDLVARALVHAWQIDPSLQMVWIGPIRDVTLATYRRSWGPYADRVHALGALERSLTYGVLQRAVAAVLPSTVDNLPNTVIESLILGVPVIGSDGASIDELVEHGASGSLVPIGNVAALAEAMLDAWKGRAGWLPQGFRTPPTITSMRPDQAVERFLELAASVGGRRP